MPRKYLMREGYGDLHSAPVKAYMIFIFPQMRKVTQDLSDSYVIYEPFFRYIIEFFSGGYFDLSITRSNKQRIKSYAPAVISQPIFQKNYRTFAAL